MTVKTIIRLIVKSIIEEKNIYSFELIYSHDLVYILVLSMLLMRPESLLLAGLVKSLDLKKCFYFYQELCFIFSYQLGMYILERCK